MDTCAGFWGTVPAGVTGDMTGATQACYKTHLGFVSDDASSKIHCLHAAGGHPCTAKWENKTFANFTSSWTWITQKSEWQAKGRWSADQVSTDCSAMETRVAQEAVELAYKDPLQAEGQTQANTYLSCLKPEMSCQSIQQLETYEVCWCKDGKSCRNKVCVTSTASPVTDNMVTKLKAQEDHDCLKVQAVKLMKSQSFGRTGLL